MPTMELEGLPSNGAAVWHPVLRGSCSDLKQKQVLCCLTVCAPTKRLLKCLLWQMRSAPSPSALTQNPVSQQPDKGFGLCIENSEQETKLSFIWLFQKQNQKKQNKRVKENIWGKFCIRCALCTDVGSSEDIAQSPSQWKGVHPASGHEEQSSAAQPQVFPTSLMANKLRQARSLSLACTQAFPSTAPSLALSPLLDKPLAYPGHLPSGPHVDFSDWQEKNSMALLGLKLLQYILWTQHLHLDGPWDRRLVARKGFPDVAAGTIACTECSGRKEWMVETWQPSSKLDFQVVWTLQYLFKPPPFIILSWLKGKSNCSNYMYI